VYDPATGLIKKIQTGISQYIEKYKEVYDTFEKDDFDLFKDDLEKGDKK